MGCGNKIAAAVHIDIVVLSAVRRYNKNRKGCVTVRILGFFVKIILKLIALPVLLGLGIVCLLAKIAFELSSFFRRTDSVHHRLQYLLCLSISVVAARPSCGNRLGGLCSIVSLCCISGDWRKHKGKSS